MGRAGNSKRSCRPSSCCLPNFSYVQYFLLHQLEIIPTRNLREIVSPTQPGACSQACFEHECAQACRMISCLDFAYAAQAAGIFWTRFHVEIVEPVDDSRKPWAIPGQSLGNPWAIPAYRTCTVQLHTIQLSGSRRHTIPITLRQALSD